MHPPGRCGNAILTLFLGNNKPLRNLSGPFVFIGERRKIEFAILRGDNETVRGKALSNPFQAINF
jgi:hypothetical protein